MFTAAAVLQLVEEGRLNLEDPLHKWLPAYPYIDSTITIRQLLNHTSGLNDFVDNPAFWDSLFLEPSRSWTPDELIVAFNRESVFAPGSDWNYTTTGYSLLRIIIMEITGSDLPAVYRDRFWVPLGLANTSTSMGEVLPSGAAHGWYDLDGDGAYEDFSSWPRTAFATGIGGEIWTTAEDLARWARALFHDGSVLEQPSMDQTLTLHAPCTGEEFIGAGYGLGVVSFNPELVYGLEAYGHGGNAPGYAAMCMYLPELEVAVGIVDNTEAGESIGLCTGKLVDVILTHLAESP